MPLVIFNKVSFSKDNHSSIGAECHLPAILFNSRFMNGMALIENEK